jgi:hypothetical protein
VAEPDKQGGMLLVFSPVHLFFHDSRCQALLVTAGAKVTKKNPQH